MAFVQTPPVLGNQFDQDRVLQSFLRRRVPQDVLASMLPSLARMGARTVGDLGAAAAAAYGEEPELVQWDAWGNRIDAIVVPEAWKLFARAAVEEGLIWTAYERASGEYSRLHQFALVYLFAPSSKVYTCPLAMTDGCARTLEVMAEPALRERVLPRLVSRDPRTAWISGQWMTERAGGSDVGLSETVARETPEGWRLWGTKWFTSAVTADVALTLGRPQEAGPGGRGLALFLVETRDAQGRLNGIEVHRLKDKLGTRMVPTAELTLNGTPAIPVAGLSDGVRNITTMLNITRTWNAVCSVASLRRGIALARDFAGRRFAFGAMLDRKPLHVDTLAEMQAEYEAAFHLTFHAVALLGRAETGVITAEETALLRLLQPLAKLTTGRQAVAGASETLEAFGGAGYIEDTGLPEILRDAQVLSIWEGTTNVLALDVLRALARTEALSVFGGEVRRRAEAAVHETALRGPAATAVAAMEHAERWLAAAGQRGAACVEAGARRFALTLGRTLALALLVDHAAWALAHEGDPRPAAAARRFARAGVDLLWAEDLGAEDAALLASDRTG
ncbi:MAG: acyl-CoA dehydrogenase [Polyangiaceae bacterium UTPRO1]|jgi:alkylation response protein AidB-like acyl-CoA dehydrogenase|nr:acyl-CoA dehydrogenase family protein [Myxococcales bacterium]OQY67134.1 MAG: acyl-CoA dehydrogenase [Polyangiaceae bacterium UTPRO1]